MEQSSSFEGKCYFGLKYWKLKERSVLLVNGTSRIEVYRKPKKIAIGRKKKLVASIEVDSVRRISARRHCVEINAISSTVMMKRRSRRRRRKKRKNSKKSRKENRNLVVNLDGGDREATFYLGFHNSQDVIEWMQMFHKFGINVFQKKYCQTERERFLRDYMTWDKITCVNFLRDFQVIDDILYRALSRNGNPLDFNGRVISELKTFAEVEKKVGIRSLGRRKKLLLLMERIRKEEFEEIFVFNKIDLVSNDNLSLNEKWSITEKLSSLESLLKEYLDYQKIVNKDEKKENKISTVIEENVNDHNQIVIEIKEESEEENEVINENEIKIIEISEKTDFLNDKQNVNNEKIPIKIVVCDMLRRSVEKLFRKYVSPIVSTVDNMKNQIREFGIFHPALIVGPFYLEWDNSGVCKPRKIKSRGAIFCFDVEHHYTFNKESIEEVCRKVGNVICKWNCKMCFNNFKKKYYEGNCQEFFDDLVETLELKINQNFVFQCLKKMVVSGTPEMAFAPSKTFRKKFNISKKTCFYSHKKLDNFYYGLLNEEPNFKNVYPEEYSLLESYDRAFWLKYLSKPKIDEYKQTKEGGCPFGVPLFSKYEYPFPN